MKIHSIICSLVLGLLSLPQMSLAQDPDAPNPLVNEPLLIADTNANGAVNAGDVAQTKGRAGQTVDATNFRSDVNANGSINAADAAIVKQYSGTSLPPP